MDENQLLLNKISTITQTLYVADNANDEALAETCSTKLKELINQIK